MSAAAVAGSPVQFACPVCRRPVLDLTPESFVRCGFCRTELCGQVFPALASEVSRPVQRGEQALEGDAVCFFHPQKRAEETCSKCGRFVCALCEMPIDKEHFCPTCLGSSLEHGMLEELVPRRIVWGQLALLSGLLPLITFMWPFYIVTGPAAVGFAIYGWRKPGSLVRGKRRVAASFGLLFGLIQIVAFVALVILVRQSTMEE